MKILIACEYSGIVSSAFRSLGHAVTSCDLLPSECSGQHYQGNVFDIINDGWDMMIAHPPCTYLCRAQIFRLQRESGRQAKSDDAIEFVRRLYDSNVPRIAIENPIGLLSTKWKKPSQIVFPWFFGDPYRKDICLWLKNLPPLIASGYSTKRKSVCNHVNSRMSQEQKSKIKSKFFPGVAAAMAQQWS